MLKRLLGEVKEYKKVSILTPICMVLEVIFETLIPFVMTDIIDRGINEGGDPDLGLIYKLGGLMIGLAIMAFLSGIGGAVFGAKASTGLAKNLRKAMNDKIQTFSFSNIDKFSTAGLVTRLTTDVTNVQNAYMTALRMGFRAPITLIFAMVAAFIKSARLAVVYLVAVLILGIVMVFIVKFGMKYFNEMFKQYDGLNATIQENVKGIRVVKSFVREGYEENRMNKASSKIYNLAKKAEGVVIVYSPVMMFTIYGSMVGVSWLGAKFIVQHTLSTGTLMGMLIYCLSILMSLIMLSLVFVMLSMSIASAGRIAEVLGEEPDITNPENPAYEMQDGSISFENASFTYHKEGNGENVLRNIDLEIKSGETIGIIGGTGSAKSTLVMMIPRLYDVTEGCVKVGGRDVKEYDLTTLRKNVSMVLQKNVLFSGSVLENLRWGNKDATLEDCKRACRLACADEFIEQLPEKYETHIEQGGTNVSGGQRQRLCIARALLANPKVLILDDSTSAVDTATDAKIRAAFADEIPDTTKIIIAQRISSVEHADRIIVMDDGVISGIGTHEELLETNAIYKDVYESQTGANADFDEVGGGN
ncbi:MAG: ABC transporter ATP-binding protein/permease [Lachnospiraceae bacterium]|nr:ABC transporter ATP-binding protein/permease [Lachnospiraceae bacterium]